MHARLFPPVMAILLAGAAHAAPLNVVLISADTLRADHLGCYGYNKPTSPTVDRLAADAVIFEDCVCPVPLTNPSFGTVLSGQYPRTTGTTRNGLHMPDRFPLITEVFRAAGYQTLCVQSNWTLKGHLSGLDRGFDIYRDDFTKKRWGFMKGERDAEDVTNTALELLGKRDPARPFFAWFHYSDPHAPYLFHPGFAPAGEASAPPNVVGEERVHLLNRVKYDSEIAYMDAQIGRLLAALPRENTAILFMADHGESLYEHGYLGHGRRIYQDNLHVPLLIAAPGLPPRRETVPVRVLDVAPTLLGLAGLAIQPPLPGHNLLRELPHSDEARFVETYGGAVPKLPGFKALMGDRPPMRRGVLRTGWKLILGGDGPELYHLSDDPAETTNVVVSYPDVARQLSDAIQAWGKQHPASAVKAVELSPEDKAMLGSLGYLE